MDKCWAAALESWLPVNHRSVIKRDVLPIVFSSLLVASSTGTEMLDPAKLPDLAKTPVFEWTSSTPSPNRILRREHRQVPGIRVPLLVPAFGTHRALPGHLRSRVSGWKGPDDLLDGSLRWLLAQREVFRLRCQEFGWGTWGFCDRGA
jgi:hypothetical protein